VLRELAKRAQLVPADAGLGGWRRLLGRRPHVWLADGHTELPPAGGPLVVQLHEAGWHQPELRATLDPAFYEVISHQTEIAARVAARVITPSDASRRDLVAAYGLDPERVHVVPHGVDPAFSPAARGGRALVARARGGAEAPYVLFASALHPRKNLAALRDAMEGLAAEGFPQILVVAGSAAADRADTSDVEREAVAELPGAPGRVVRIRGADDLALAGLMAEADAFCLPSLHEGFGLTALEAMACGAPVVVSDRGALPEVVGDAGLVVPPTGSDVREALRLLLADPQVAQRLRHAAIERAHPFTWARTGEGWLSVLKLAARRGLH
jgi:glycosyltransferase involved in cell wall biosynthesis